MNYYSLNKQSSPVSFKEATIRGQAPDRGLYFPETIPCCDTKLINNIADYSNEAIAYEVIRPYVESVMPDDIIKKIVAETVDFDIPLVKVNEKMFALELFHGPTLAFKDIGARFMSRCLGYFTKGEKQNVTVLVATSGDTGGAVANGFFGVDGVDVVILYPSGKVSPVQEKQLTTLGKNIRALEVKGNFDDCQRMVKQAFMDAEINLKLFLTSANSINVARWLPQQFYYFFAWKQWQDKNRPPVISVPSGNFGNICAGILAHASGLPVKHFVAACNANKTVPDYLQTGVYQPREAVSTISNAMDVGDPSNFVRVLEIFHQQIAALKKSFSSYSISDADTRQNLQEVFEREGYVLDPHGSVGYVGLKRYLADHGDEKGIFLETAHPVKFPEVVEELTGKPVVVPEKLAGLMGREKRSTVIDGEYSELKSFLMKD